MTDKVRLTLNISTLVWAEINYNATLNSFRSASDYTASIIKEWIEKEPEIPSLPMRRNFSEVQEDIKKRTLLIPEDLFFQMQITSQECKCSLSSLVEHILRMEFGYAEIEH
jgi:hypothetical protein